MYWHSRTMKICLPIVYFKCMKCFSALIQAYFFPSHPTKLFSIAYKLKHKIVDLRKGLASPSHNSNPSYEKPARSPLPTVAPLCNLDEVSLTQLLNTPFQITSVWLSEL